MAITITIVEDNTAVRQSMLDMLEGAPDCKCVGSFASGEEELSEIPKLRPQVVLMDISLAGMDGVECVRRLAKQMDLPQILMLTVHEDPDSIFNSLAAGAAGYLLKPVRATQLVAAPKHPSCRRAPQNHHTPPPALPSPQPVPPPRTPPPN